jgi:hypothetical protein
LVGELQEGSHNVRKPEPKRDRSMARKAGGI